MELKEVIENRRSIRSFENKDINKETVEDIINCGRLAPSAKNKQPWYFVILKNEIKDKVADLMIEYDQNIMDKQSEKAKIKYPSSVKSTGEVIKEAPVLILIFREKDDNWIIGDNLSIGACVENMCLRATDLGLGSLWIRDTVYVANDIAKMLKKEDMELNCALLLGYQNEFPNQRPRKKLKDIIEWYMAGLNIKLALVQDIKDILELIKLRCDWLEKNNIEQWGDWYYKELYNMDYFLNNMKINQLYVVKNESELIGLFLIKNNDELWKDNEEAYYLHHFITKVGYSGIGDEILKYITKLSIKNDVKYIRLDCVKNNSKLNDYYINHGFIKVGDGEIAEYSYNLYQKRIK